MDELEGSPEISEPRSAEEHEAEARRMLLEATNEEEGALAWHVGAAQVHATLALLDALTTACNQLTYIGARVDHLARDRGYRGP